LADPDAGSFVGTHLDGIMTAIIERAAQDYVDHVLDFDVEGRLMAIELIPASHFLRPADR
jgi:hypothetical protein